jgi:sporulation integral membrane protein YtvI
MIKPVSEKMVRAGIILGVLILIAFIIHYTFIYLLPFLIALMVAFLLDPLVSYLENRLNRSRTFATTLVMMGFTGIFLILFYFIIVKVIGELGTILDHVPNVIQKLKWIFLSFGQQINEKLSNHLPQLTDWDFENHIEQFMDNLASYSMGLFSSAIQIGSGALSSLSYSVFSLVFILLAIYMLTKDLHLFKEQTAKIIPDKIHYYFAPVFAHVKKAFVGLMKAQIIITFITSILFLIGLVFFQVEHVIAITLTIFFIDFIPYIGIGLILIPWIGYLFLTGQYILTMEVTILYILIIIVRQFLEPRLIASSIGIHPFIALSILFISFQTLGIVGVIVTPFILIMISAFHQAGVFLALWHYVNDC